MALQMKAKILRKRVRRKSICAHASMHIQCTYGSVYTVYTAALERMSNVYSIHICLYCLYSFYFYLVCVYVSACLYICRHACPSACTEVRWQGTSDQKVHGHNSTSTMPTLHLRFSKHHEKGQRNKSQRNRTPICETVYSRYVRDTKP